MRGSSTTRRTLRVALGAAAALTAAAVANRVMADRAEHKMPPLGRFMDVDGVRLHYVERGQGRPLVLLHGNGAMIQDMMVSGLLFGSAENHRVIAFDRPGFGYSDRPRSTVWTPEAQAALLHKALKRLGVERPIVLGHSWGALVALAMALDPPGEVAALVLVSGYYFPTPRLDAVTSLPSALPVIGDVLTHTVSPILGRVATPAMVKKLFAPAPVTKRFRAFPTELCVRASQLRAAAEETVLMVPAATALSRRYGELTIPVTIVAGEGDRIVSSEHQSERLHSVIAHSRLIGVAGAGHMVHHSAPDRVLAAIDAAAAADRRLA